jgi:drug/metabolite transporter superfamily protein YnfA
MAMAAQEQEVGSRISRRSYFISIRDNPTLQPANFGRVYAAYGGVFILSSIIWGMLVDKKKPDRYEIIGSIIAIAGALVIFYGPR